MEVTRLADDLICFSLSTEELQDENIDINRIDHENYMEELEPLLGRLIHEATTTYELKFEGFKLTTASYVVEGTLKVIVSSANRSIDEIQEMIAEQEKERKQDEFIEDELAVHEAKKAEKAKKTEKKCQRQLGFVAEFYSLHEVIALAKTYKFKDTKSTLYHDKKAGKYILAFSSDNADAIILAGNIVIENTGKNLKQLRSTQHLDEHMDIIIKENACATLGKL